MSNLVTIITIIVVIAAFLQILLLIIRMINYTFVVTCFEKLDRHCTKEFDVFMMVLQSNNSPTPIYRHKDDGQYYWNTTCKKYKVGKKLTEAIVTFRKNPPKAK